MQNVASSFGVSTFSRNIESVSFASFLKSSFEMLLRLRTCVPSSSDGYLLGFGSAGSLQSDDALLQNPITHTGLGIGTINLQLKLRL